MDTICSAETSPADRKCEIIYPILTKINRYFGTFWDISKFKRTFNSILQVERSAHYMQGRNKHRSSKFATTSSILTKIYRYFGLARDISSFKRTFYSILYADRSGRGFQLGNMPSGAKFATIYSIFILLFLSRAEKYSRTSNICFIENIHSVNIIYNHITVELYRIKS